MRALALTLSGLNAALSKINYQSELEQRAKQVLENANLDAEFEGVSFNAEIAAIDKGEVQLNIEHVETVSDSKGDDKQPKHLLQSTIPRIRI